VSRSCIHKGSWCPHRYKSGGFKSGVERGGHAVGPLRIRRSRCVLLRARLIAQLNMPGHHHACTTAVLWLSVALADRVRWNSSGVACKPMWQNMRAYQSPTNHAYTLILNRCWCLYSRTHLFLIWYVELLPEVCMHLSVFVHCETDEVIRGRYCTTDCHK
jgi:hypothetical protein